MCFKNRCLIAIIIDWQENNKTVGIRYEKPTVKKN
jgi:hypothetical protein